MINKASFFDYLTTEEIDILKEKSIEHTIPAKKVFIEQESPTDTIYFITEGSVMVFKTTVDGEEIPLAILGTGDIVGEMAGADQNKRSATVRALQNTKVLAITGTNFRQVIQLHPQIALALLFYLTQRIRNINQVVEDISTQALIQRTWKTLSILKKHFINNEVTLTHEELASIIGATRARVSETLNILEDEGKVILSAKKITVL